MRATSFLRGGWLLVAGALASCALESGAPDAATKENVVAAIPQALIPSPDTLCTSADFEGKKYFFCANDRNQQTAESKCNTANSNFHLASIETSGENEFIRSHIVVDAWISGTDAANEGTWLWQTGVEFWQGGSGGTSGGQYANWATGQPNNTFNQDCVLIDDNSPGRWSDESCSSTRDYVCEGDGCPLDDDKTDAGQCGCGTPDTDTDGDTVADCIDECDDDEDKTAPGICGCGTPDTDSDGDGAPNCADGCPQDNDRVLPPCSPDTDCEYETFDGVDYFFCDNYRDWPTAKEKCEAVGMDLVRIDSEAENDFIADMIITDRWTGGTDQAIEGEWRWADDVQFWQGAANGQSVDNLYENWDTFEPNSFPDEDCLQLDNDADWRADECDNHEQYICEDACPFESKTQPRQCGCGVAETDSDGDDVADCVDRCPEDQEKTEPEQCGCGEEETDTDGDKLPDCIDPCPLDNDPTLGNECGCPSDDTADAGTPCNGVCSGSGNSSGLDECDGDGHCGDPGGCPPPEDNCGCVPFLTIDQVFWYCTCQLTRDDAEDACDDLPGLTLVSIRDSGDNAFIRSQIVADTWIGANDRSVENEWHWGWAEGDDGTRFWDGATSGVPYFGRYANWQTGEPGGGGTVDCAAMSATGPEGYWQDRSCGESLGFFCGRSLDDAPDINTTPPAEPTCAALGLNCGPFDTTCVDPSTLPGGTLTEQEDDLRDCNQCVVDNCGGKTAAECEALCDASCTGAAEKPTGGTCEDLDDYDVASGQEQRCTVKSPSTQACTSHADCSARVDGKTHCGWYFHCRECDPSAGACPACMGETGTDPGSIECDLRTLGPSDLHPGDTNRCLADLFCGLPIDNCFLDDNSTDLCAEHNLCIDPANEHDPAPPDDIPELLEPEVLDPETAFGPKDEPTQNTTQFSDDPPCSGASCSPPLDDTHPWCHYVIDEDLEGRNPESLQKPVNAGAGGLLTFDFEPSLNLTYTMDNGALGLPMPLVSAAASFHAGAHIEILGVNEDFDIIDLAASAEGGIRNDLTDRLCGFKANGSAIVMEMDLLPDGLDFARPEQAVQDDCIEAVDEFQEVVDRARKAFADARNLLQQYDNLAPGTNFSDGTGAAESLCEQIAKSPPRDFPASIFTCAAEPPEYTIDRFVYYYNSVVIGQVRDAASNLAARLDDWAAVQQSWPVEPNVDEQEEITIWNSTFLVGPVPVNLEVLMLVQYGIDISVDAEFKTGELMRQLVFGQQPDASKAFVKVGASGGPSAGVGVSLFAGVGFDIGFASAKIGIDGAVDLGHMRVPVSASAGIGLGTEADPRVLSLPAAWADTIDTSQPQLIPTQKLKFSLLYEYGARLQLDEVLNGSIGVKLKLSFLFFSIKYRQPIVKFNGFCQLPGNTEPCDESTEPCDARQDWCDIRLFTSGGRTEWEWGTIQMPMPFLPLRYLTTLEPPGTATFSTAAVSELFYDSLCTCIDEGVTDPECFRDDDCCETIPSDDNRHLCFDEPTGPPAPKECTGCRRWGESCNTVDDCCNNRTFICLDLDDPNNPASPNKRCHGLSDCSFASPNNTACADNEDCRADLECDMGECKHPASPPNRCELQ